MVINPLKLNLKHGLRRYISPVTQTRKHSSNEPLNHISTFLTHCTDQLKTTTKTQNSHSWNLTLSVTPRRRRVTPPHFPTDFRAVTERVYPVIGRRKKSAVKSMKNGKLFSPGWWVPYRLIPRRKSSLHAAAAVTFDFFLYALSEPTLLIGGL